MKDRPYRVGKSPINGYGVFATRNLSKGELLPNILCTNPEHRLGCDNGPPVSKFGGFNRSCKPNIRFLNDGFMGSTMDEIERGILDTTIIRDIVEGEEMTADYPLRDGFVCNCNECRGSNV